MAPMASQTPEATAAIWNGRLDGFCCSAKIRPPMEGASSLAAILGARPDRPAAAWRRAAARPRRAAVGALAARLR